MTNNGTITLGGTNAATEFRPTPGLSLSGTGTLLLASSAVSNNINLIGLPALDNSDFFYHNSGHTILATGPATLGRNTIKIFNTGTIAADTPTGNLLLNPNVLNNISGQIRATNGAIIHVAGVGIASGTVSTTNGGLISLETGGGLGNVAFSGTAIVPASNSASLSGGSLAGTLTIHNGGTLYLGTTTNNGEITLNGTNATTLFRPSASTTLNGTGSLVIGANGVASNINIIASAGSPTATLTNGPSHTIRSFGLGQLGGGNTILTNNGLVSAEASTLTYNPLSSTNNGILRATGASTTISIPTGSHSNTGTIEALAGSTIASGGVNVLTNLDSTNSTLIGGTYRAVSATLDVAPNNFDLRTLASPSVATPTTIELSGAATTNLFAETNTTGVASLNPAPGTTLSQNFAAIAGPGVLKLSDHTFNAVLPTSLPSGVFSLSGDLILSNAAFNVLAITAGAPIPRTLSAISDATLSGTGSINANVTSDATLIPGTNGTLGTLALTSLDLNSKSKLQLDVSAALTADLLQITNSLDLAGQLLLSIDPAFSAPLGTLIPIATTPQPTGAFASITDNSPFFNFLPLYNSATQTLSLQVTPIPEPATLALLPLTALLLPRRRR